MAEYKRKLMPFLSCDVPAIEKWLCDMAGKGLLYESSGVFCVRFEVSEPVNRRYRLECADVVGCKIKDEKREMYEDSGWTVVNDLKSDLVVVYTDDEAAPEPYDEPEQIAHLQKLCKRQRWLGVLLIAMFLFSKIAAPITSVLYGNIETLHSLINIGTWKYILIAFMALLLLCEGIFRLIRAGRLKKYIVSLQNNGEDGKKLTKKSTIGTALILLTLPLVILWAVHLFPFFTSGEWYYPADPEDVYPFPSLEEINADEYAQLNELWDNGAGIYTSREDSDLLAPKIVKFSAECWVDPHVRYNVTYYEMKSEKLAKQMYDEEIAYYQVYTPLEMSTRSSTYQYVLRHEGKMAANEYLNTVNKSYDFYDELNRGNPEDVMYIVDQNGHNEYITDPEQRDGSDTRYQSLFVRSGNKLICVHYLGQSDLKDFVELYVSYINK